MELVSAIITTHNRCELLRRAIDSVSSQTYPLIELIVVDDHSDDGTNEICKDPRINYIYIPKDESRGGNYARNLGIKASKGKYCAFLDDDDYWLPTKIEKQVELIEKEKCELVYCGVRTEYVKRKGVFMKDGLPSPIGKGDMSKAILQFIPTTTSCILVDRKSLFDVGLFDENLRFWQEYELCIRMAQRKPFYFVNESLMVYRLNQRDKNRLTNKYWEWRKAVEYIHQKHAGLYKQLSLIEKYKAVDTVWTDAANRCWTSGFVWRSLYFQILTLPRKVMSFVKNVFNS